MKPKRIKQTIALGTGGSLAVFATIFAGQLPQGAEAQSQSSIPEAGIRQAPVARAPRETNLGMRLPQQRIRPVRGAEQPLFATSGARVTVVALTSATCPISKKYTPSLARLEEQFAERGVRWVFLNPMDVETAAEVRDHSAAFDGPYVHDKSNALAQALGALTTTEVFVFDSKQTLVYRGAVDDQYGFGYQRETPRFTYLVDALEAVLRGEVPPIGATTAPGCKLSLKPTTIPAMAPTYHNQVSRIIQNNCMSCHRPGGVGPFALDTFDAVKRRAPMIRFVVDSKRMPPWFAAPLPGETESPWKNDRSLSDTDRKALLDWIAAGMPEGDPKEAPAPRTWPSQWDIGKPDLIVQVPRPFAVQAEGEMPYQYATVETGLTEDRWVEAMQIIPTARNVVHHVLVFILLPGQRLTEDLEGVAGFFAGYVPGNDAQVFPPGFAKMLPKGSRLRFQIHYTPNGEATTDQVKIGIRFAKRVPDHEVKTAAIAELRLRIPPGAKRHEVQATLPVPFEAHLLSFMPHMHVRGTAYRYELQRADGTRRTLLDIPRYDFNWQLEYQLAQPVPVQRGDRLIGTAWFDNSADNPANPDPTRWVTWGEQTSDEMKLGYLSYYVPLGEQRRMRPRLFGR